MLRLPKYAKIVEKFRYVLIVFLAVVVAGLVFGFVRVGTGDTFLNFGIDFTGGATIEITSDEQISADNQSKIVDFIQADGYRVNGDVQETDATEGYIYEIRLSYERNGKTITDEVAFLTEIFESGNDQDLCGRIYTEATENLSINLEDNSVRAYAVGQTASDSLVRAAVIATIVAIVVMLIYTVIRFTFSSALAAVCALAHDVIVMIALMSIFNVTINSTFIAAVITIIGYSINATIVIFDRVRAELKLTTSADKTDKEIANKAVCSTLAVTILSTLTTLIMVVFLAIFSVTTIQEFILPIIFGLVAGAISSTIVAPALWIQFRKLGKKIVKNKKNTGYTGAAKQDS